MNYFFAILSGLLFLVIIFIYSNYIKEKKERIKTVRKNNKLKAELALMETEQLKFQLQPHTLNNILMNLKLMAKKLNKGMDALSETLDYILYKGNEKHLVSVEDEFNFILKYLALNDLFISEINSIKIHDSDLNKESYYFKNPCIPHLITAHFIENAFKHGDVDHSDFLTITICLSENEFKFTVVNKIKKNVSVNENKGIGLNNMTRRLDILARDRYSINHSCNETEYYSMLAIQFTK